jgi:hypothetical protein
MFETKAGTIKPIVYVGLIQENRLLLVNYKTPPNPSKGGWWIPTPGLDFGEDPTEKATTLISDFGFSSDPLRLHGVESFVLPGGWHLIYHFVCPVAGEFKNHKNINDHKWVTLQELELIAKDLAHGKWEAGVGRSYLKQ